MLDIDIAVAIPTYNSAKFVGKAIESVRVQSSSIPIYIYDNCSSDDTVEICKGYKNINITINERNCGYSINIKNCFTKTPHQFISLLLSDDWFGPAHLETASKIFGENPEINYYFGAAIKVFLEKRGEHVWELPIAGGRIEERALLPLMIRSLFTPVSSIIINKDVLECVPDSCWARIQADYELMIHLSINYRGWFEEEPNVYFLQRKDSLGQNWTFEVGFLFDRIEILFSMNEIYSLPRDLLGRIIRLRWLECLLLALYKVERNTAREEAIEEIMEVKRRILANGGEKSISRFLLLIGCFFVFVVRYSPRWVVGAMISMSRVIGLGRHYLR
jgi:glycosyltransferase involved in cell wall biosynthesis